MPTGSVIRQDPPAGEKVARGSAVNIVVSSGSPSPTASPSPAGVEVPNVYGMDATTAAAQVSAAGLVADFRQKGGTGQEPGTVVSIKPDAGTVVPEGSTVVLDDRQVARSGAAQDVRRGREPFGSRPLRLPQASSSGRGARPSALSQTHPCAWSQGKMK